MTTAPTISFSNDYEAARHSFIALCEQQNIPVTSYKHHLAGLNGETLSCDVARLGNSEASDQIIIVSGVHGPEGFAGSACQCSLIQTWSELNIPPSLGVVLIHTINPWGMSFIRRTTEDNVDLNRNFIVYEQASGSEPILDKICERAEITGLGSDAIEAADTRLLEDSTTHGPQTVLHALARGQSTRPAGLHYTGQEPTWSRHRFNEIINQVTSGIHRSLLIDLHTGFGEYGEASVMCDVPLESQKYQRAKRWFSGTVTSYFDPASDFPPAPGHLPEEFDRISNAKETTAITVEFGTVPPIEHFRTSRVEHWLHHNGHWSHPEAEQIKTNYRQGLDPDDDGWRQSVGQGFWRILNEAIGAFRT